MIDAAPRPSARAITIAAAVGAAVAVVVILVSSGGHIARMTFGDGVLHRYVAENLIASETKITHDLAGHGTALRYGRIGLPALLWLGSAGRPWVMPYVQPALMVLSSGAVAAAARALLPNLGISAAIAPFIAVGLLASVAGGFAEPVALAFALWGVVAARKAHWAWAIVALMAAVLTRENAVAIVVGLGLWLLMQRRVRPATTLALSLVPAAVWHLLVGARFGFLPLADPFLTKETDAVGPPFVGMWRSLATLEGRPLFLLVTHVALIVLALVFWRSGDVGMCALVAGIVLTASGPHAWRFVGDAARLGLWLQVTLILTLLSLPRLTSSREELRR